MSTRQGKGGTSRRIAAALASLLPLVAAAQGPGSAGSRGRLLYDHHCIACHSTQMHWRNQKLATDWPSLKAQVRRWQAAAQLNWSEDDIDEVARFLNDAIYRLPAAGKVVELARPG
jgi:mono/diheme cytochrome c family protein